MNESLLTEYNVVAVSFEKDDMAYAGLARLKQLDADALIELRSAAVVEREPDGHVTVKDTTGKEEWEATAGGGIIGLLVGILGGPLGVLIGGATGVLVGSLFDLEDEDDTESVLSAFAAKVRPRHNVLLAEMREPSDHEVVDGVMASRSGSVLRSHVADVEAEIAATEKAQREARKKARKELRHEREAKQKADVEAKVAELKAKLPNHRGNVPAGTTS
ncbi:MAG TPA: hypothetical protein VMI13_10255 [Solirubrobacteraceae bacterium]|nr:hypothetical protein [Solirubrobacteraceae bacterium]